MTTSSSISSEPRWLIVGGDGMIGDGLAAALAARGAAVAATSRRRDTRHRSLDLATAPSAWTLPACDIAILCAAVSRIADCEANAAAAARINVAAPLALAERIWSQGGFVVFLSSSAVFDGCADVPTPDTPPRPLNPYGRHKAAAEAALREAAAGRGLAIIRPTKVLCRQTPLLRDWAAALATGEAITPHADRWMAPLHLHWATAAIIEIAAARASGTWHLSAQDDVSYADFARRWATAQEYRLDRLQPHPAADPGLPRARLDMTATTARFGIAAPPAADCIAALAREAA